MAGPFSLLSLLPAAALAAKSLSVSPGSSALVRAPTGTRRKAGETARRRWLWLWQQRPRAQPWLRVQSAPKEEFFALPSLPFHSLFFFPRGVKKPHNLRMCARVKIDVGRKKKKRRGECRPGPCGRRRSAPPCLGFPGAEGEADSAGRCCLILLPPPLPSALSLSALARRGEESFSSPPPPLRPAMPGHFCYLETFPPRESPRPSPHGMMDKWHRHTPEVGSGRDWTRPIQGHAGLAPVPSCRPTRPGQAILTRRMLPRPSKKRSFVVQLGGGVGASSNAAEKWSGWMPLPGCSALF